jgi:hypothetical protein
MTATPVSAPEPARATPSPLGLPVEAVLAARGLAERWVTRRTWLAVLLGAVVSSTFAGLERQHAELGAADRALGGAALGVALPLVAYIASDSALGRRNLRSVLDPLVRHGASPAAASAGLVGALSAALALSGVAIALSTTLFARRLGDGALLLDLFSSAWIFALGGAVYGAWFALASTFGKRGGGRKWFLAFDFVLGVSNGVLALPWPRSHLRNLVGGAPPLDLGQGTSAWALLALGLAAAWYTTRRARG